MEDLFKLNKHNSIITLLYIFISFIPFMKYQPPCFTTLCPARYNSLFDLFGPDGLWIWLFTVICVYILVSFIYFKFKK